MVYPDLEKAEALADCLEKKCRLNDTESDQKENISHAANRTTGLQEVPGIQFTLQRNSSAYRMLFSRTTFFGTEWNTSNCPKKILFDDIKLCVTRHRKLLK